MFGSALTCSVLGGTGEVVVDSTVVAAVTLSVAAVGDIAVYEGSDGEKDSVLIGAENRNFLSYS